MASNAPLGVLDSPAQRSDEEGGGRSAAPLGILDAPAEAGFRQRSEEDDFDIPLVPEVVEQVGASFVEETVRDLEGAAKVVGAAAFSPLAMMSDSAPITFDDVTKRDVQGALMVGALGVGGLAAGAARATPFLSRLASRGALGRAASLAGGEAAAGAAFGAIRPLSEDESRIEAVAKDAGFGAVFGAGFSFFRSAAKATIGGKVADLKAAITNRSLASTARKFDQEQLGRELAGIELVNPETGATRSIRRKVETGEVVSTFVNESGDSAATRTFDSFDTALEDATSEGFLQRAGPARTTVPEDVTDLDAATLDLITGEGRQIREDLQRLQFEEYASVQQAAKQFADAEGELGALAAEIPTPADEFGVPTLAEDTRKGIERQLPKNLRDLPDHELLREGVRRGVVSVEAMEGQVGTDTMIRELFLNGRVPDKRNIVTSRSNDLFLKLFRTADNIAQSHPVVRPLVEEADKRMIQLERNLSNHRSWLGTLRESVPDEAAERGVRIIDNSAVDEAGNVRSIEDAREAALAAARETGDENVEDFVKQTTAKLSEVRRRAVEAGQLDEGLPGYFPIVNSGSWRLGIRRAGQESLEFRGFSGTQKEALEQADVLRQQLDDVEEIVVRPKEIAWEADVLTELSPEQFDQLQKAIRESAEISVQDAEDVASQVARVDAGQSPTRTSRFFKKRALGMREYADDPFESLNAYLNNVERSLQFGDIDRVADDVIRNIPEDQSNLRAWAEQLRADLKGQPRPVERAFDATLEALDINAKPRALKRYASALRNWEMFSRLGGFWSGIVNSTQVAVNTLPVLGARWTAEGMKVFRGGMKTFRSAVDELADAGVNIDLYVPLSEAGESAVKRPQTSRGRANAALREMRNGNVKKSLQQGGRAFQNIALFVFNSAEKVNRTVTAWGAFQRELSKGRTRSEAASIAQEIMEQTQFNYRLSNMPEILRGPAGKTIGQFKSFIVNQLEFMSDLVGVGRGRQIQPGALGKMGGVLFGLGGASLMLNTPGAGLVDKASGVFMDGKLSEKLKAGDIAGLDPQEDPLDKLVVFGLPGLLGDIDISDYVGTGKISEITRGLAGPAVSDLQTVADFVTNAAKDVQATGGPGTGRISDETKTAFLQQIMPSAARRAERAFDIAKTGDVRNPYTGKLIYRPQERYQTAFFKFLGAPSTRAQQERAMDAIAGEARRRYVQNHSALARKAAKAALEGDTDRVARIRREAAEMGVPISDRSLQFQRRALQNPAALRRRRRTPQALRQELDNLFEATGMTSLEKFNSGTLGAL